MDAAQIRSANTQRDQPCTRGSQRDGLACSGSQNRRAARRRQTPAVTRQDPGSGRRQATPATTATGRRTGRRTPIHQAYRYDARPPRTDPDTWWYLCDACGSSRINGAELQASPIHVVPTLEGLISTGKPLISYVQHGGQASAAAQERAADPSARSWA
jgi:hypothetical protein